MAITTTNVNNTDTTVYTSTGTNGISFLSLCNHSALAQVVSIFIVPSPDGILPGTVSTANILIKDIDIVAGETFSMYQGNEKIILDPADFISVIAGTTGTVTAIVSNMLILG